MDDPIYEMGKAYPVAYVKELQDNGWIKPTSDLDDAEWLEKKRANVWYECENCGWRTKPPPPRKWIRHQCPDGHIPDKFTTANPFDELAIEQALRGLMKILNDQEVA